MATHVLTRQALFDRVWAEPTSVVASSLGISGVGLGRACQVAGIPVPPRGYWAKLRHGKPVITQPNLPPTPLGRPETVVIIPPRPKAPSTAVTRAREQARLEVFIAPEPTPSVHRIVQQWLDDNAAAKRARRKLGWGPLPEDLTAPMAARRLRLFSMVLNALEERGIPLASSPKGVLVSRLGVTLTLTIRERTRLEPRRATPEELRWRPGRTTVRGRVLAGDLVVKLVEPETVQSEFKDLDAPLETQIRDIVASVEAGLVELAELRRTRMREAERQVERDMQRRRAAAHRVALDAQSEKLFAIAEQHRRASIVRSFVQAADASDAAQRDGYAYWRAWALAEAAALDPLETAVVPFRLVSSEDDHHNFGGEDAETREDRGTPPRR